MRSLRAAFRSICAQASTGSADKDSPLLIFSSSATLLCLSNSPTPGILPAPACLSQPSYPSYGTPFSSTSKSPPRILDLLQAASIAAFCSCERVPSSSKLALACFCAFFFFARELAGSAYLSSSILLWYSLYHFFKSSTSPLNVLSSSPSSAYIDFSSAALAAFVSRAIPQLLLYPTPDCIEGGQPLAP